MGKKGRRKARRQKESAKSAWHRYGFWVLGITLAIAIVVIGIIASQGDGNRPTSSTPPIPGLSEIPRGTELPPSSFLPGVPRISAEEVKAKWDAGANIVFVDSRSRTDYEKSHIAGAISIPIPIMAEPYSDINGYDEIIAYCN